MVFVITLEALPLTRDVLHALVYTALQAAEERPVVLRTTQSHAETIYNSILMELFVDFIPNEAPILDGMTQFDLQDGILSEDWEKAIDQVVV